MTDYPYIHLELAKPGVTMALLWEEYCRKCHEAGETPQSKSYVWLYRTGGDTEYPIVLYEYQPDRKKERPKEFRPDSRGICTRTGTPGTMTCRMASRWWVAGLMPDGNSTRP